MEEITTRDLIPDEDFPFIIDSWLRSYYGHSFFCQNVPKTLFFKNHAEVVKKLLARATTKLAVKTDDPNIIVGYICFEKEKNTLHYIYVKESFRNFGICKSLISQQEFHQDALISHLTLKGRKIQLNMGYRYSPYFD